MTSNEIRESFLKFFEGRDHRRVASSSLVPQDDPTLLFANAGMNQFKNVFLGLEERDYRRATSSQKCVRAGGKHNDLDSVGPSARHHTFFEMLGNFSFGDYFKEEAIEFAWELVTRHWEMPTDKLWATVYEEDEEARKLWIKIAGLPADRVVGLGVKDNYWAMGDTGPCGPCSEIYFDLGPTVGCGRSTCSVACECGRYLEFWNLVFMQFERSPDGTKSQLPKASVDTGAGLERIASVLQGVLSNYDTDLLRPLIGEIEEITARSYGEDDATDVAMRVMADHSRSAAFLIGDGVLPSNEGRGYVLRRILRRATRHGLKLGLEKPMIYRTAAFVTGMFRDAYPELEKNRELIARAVKAEETSFIKTLHTGKRMLEEVFKGLSAKGETLIPGRDLFRLYDTHGVHLDLVRDLAEDRGFQVDEDGFRLAMEKQVLASSKGQTFKGEALNKVHRKISDEHKSTFLGYESVHARGLTVKALVSNGAEVDSLGEGAEGEIVLDETPFYAESGGQVSDQGAITGDTGRAMVLDANAPVAGTTFHRVRIIDGSMHRGDLVQAKVDEQRRQSIASNHTATHILHYALREVLGDHVKQAGSLVAPDRLRFDFTHFQAVSHEELQRIETLANDRVRRADELATRVENIDDALAEGATALFGEKYSARVRVVSIADYSKELCGGTHLSNTGQVGFFKIVSEGSVAAGTRRVEAVTGEEAVRRVQNEERLLRELSESTRVEIHELPETISRLQSSLKESEKEIQRLKLKLAEGGGKSEGLQATEVKGVKVLTREVGDLDTSAMRNLGDSLKQQLGSGVVVLGTRAGNKVRILVTLTADLADKLDAVEIVNRVAEPVDGRGGGRKDFAQAGGKMPENLPAALERASGVVENFL